MLGRARLGPALGRQGCGASAPAADTLIHKNVATDEHGSASVSPFLIRAIRAESCPALMFHGKIQRLFWHQHEQSLSAPSPESSRMRPETITSSLSKAANTRNRICLVRSLLSPGHRYLGRRHNSVVRRYHNGYLESSVYKGTITPRFTYSGSLLHQRAFHRHGWRRGV
jgi:hypothetical protein